MKLVVTLLSIFSLTAYAAANRKIDAGTVEFKQQATPSTPASGYNRVYAKPDGKVYNLTSAGVEAELGAGGGGGAKNYIQNPNAATDATTGVTYTNVTAGRDSSGGLFEDTNFSFTIDSATDVVSFAADAFDPYLQNTGLCQAEFTWTADANGENVQAQVFRNGAVIGQKNLYTTGSTSPATASIAFLCGDLVNATTFRIVGTAATSTALKLSQVKLTEAQWSKDPVGSLHKGTAKWAGTASCQWSRVSNQSWGSFSADSDCPQPTISGTATITAPSTKIPAITIPSAEAGKVYTFEVKGALTAQSSSQICSFRLSDGTTNSAPVAMGFFADMHFPGFIAEYVPTSSGSKTVEIQATGSIGNTSCAINVDSSFRELEITVREAPRDQAVVNLKAQSGDVDWRTGLTFTPSAGFGTVTNTNYWYRRVNDSMEVRLTFTPGTVAASVASIQLPANHEIDTTKFSSATNIQVVGQGVTMNSASTAVFSGNAATVVFYDGSTANTVFISSNTNSSQLTKQNGSSLFSTGVPVTFNFTIPIKGWTKSNTAVNIAGEPGSWSGFHSGSDCRFDRAGSTLGDFGTDSTCTFSERVNNNFGAVTSYASSGVIYFPGVTLTPKVTGVYEVCAIANAVANSSNPGELSLTDGTSELAKIPVRSGSFGLPQTGCGLWRATAGTPANIRLQGRISGGDTISIGPNSGALPTTNGHAIEWTIKPITQNLPGLLGGGGGTAWATYTPTFTGFGTVTDVNFQWKQIDSDTIIIQGYFICGTPTSTEGRFTLPNSKTTSTFYNPFGAGGMMVGKMMRTNATTNDYNILANDNLTYLSFGRALDGNSGLTLANGNQVCGSGNGMSIFATVAIQ